jgi:hypothetical protein
LFCRTGLAFNSLWNILLHHLDVCLTYLFHSFTVCLLFMKIVLFSL